MPDCPNTAAVNGRKRLSLLFGAVVCLFILACVAPGQAGGGNTVFLEPDGSNYDLASASDILEDPAKALTIGQVSSPEMAAKFRANSSSKISLAPDSCVWVRFSIRGCRNNKGTVQRWFLDVNARSLLDLNIYVPEAGNPGSFREIASGTNNKADNESSSLCSFIFSLWPALDQNTTYYIRVQDQAPQIFSLSLLSSIALAEDATLNSLYFGAIYGILLAMAVYNFFLFISLREKVYLLYVSYILCFLLNLVLENGLAAPLGLQFLVPRFNWVSLGGVIFFSAWFIRVFLDTKGNNPLIHKLFYATQVLGAMLALGGAFGQYELAARLSEVGGLLGPILAVVAGIYAWGRGYSPAKYLTLAYIVFLLGVVPYILWLMGILPPEFPGGVIFCLAPSLEAVLLSLALADRIRSLESENRALDRSRRNYQQASMTDQLTGLPNRRLFDQRFAEGLNRAKSSGEDLSFLILDIDDFKKVNDTYGHGEGDKALKLLAGIIESCARSDDTPCRYGGEEFVLLLPKADAEQARQVAERIRQRLEQSSFDTLSGQRVSVTISIGVAQAGPDETMQSLFTRADEALYRAKQKGKNQVLLSV